MPVYKNDTTEILAKLLYIQFLCDLCCHSFLIKGVWAALYSLTVTLKKRLLGVSF
jgi:hypothetical protein